MNKQQLIHRLYLAGYKSKFQPTNDKCHTLCYVIDKVGNPVAKVTIIHNNCTNVKYFFPPTNVLKSVLTYSETYSPYCRVQCRGFVSPEQFHEVRINTMREF